MSQSSVRRHLGCDKQSPYILVSRGRSLPWLACCSSSVTSSVVQLKPQQFHHVQGDNGLSSVTLWTQINTTYFAVPCNFGQLLFLSQLILPFTPMFYCSHISLLTTVSVWRRGLQDVFKSLPLMSCWGWPSVFASPTEAVPGTGSWLLSSLGFCWG